MELRLYNTLSRKKEKFEPLKPGAAGIYTCGPTVYDYAHIGNLRTYIFEDVLVRAFKLFGYGVKRVMNTTDVGHLTSDADTGEDKMEVGARREGKSAWDVAKFYTEAFFKDYRALNCLMPDILCPATDYIKEMVELVLALEKKGFTYRIGDGIYFDTAKLPDYGKLAGKSHIEGIKEGARVEANAEKRNPADFALWKFSRPEEKRQMEWDSPWGRGFPGWHVECSAMAMKHLGETIDIHCGGEDAVAVHHTNEIAQSEAATGKPFANYWLHGRFLVMGELGKMSKSAGGFITVQTLAGKGIDPLDYRYFCFTAHYRKQLEFTWESLDSSGKALAALRGTVAKLAEETTFKKTAAKLDKGSAYYLKFVEALADDLNVPQALAALWETLRSPALAPEEKLGFALAADEVLGLELNRAPVVEALPPELLAMVEERRQARKNKDFKRSDELRKALLERGVLIEDTPQGAHWKLVKKQ
ncbi:MAG: cysteine--tRNA ligase [Elusimicrobia bacterium GWA2_56_46]|nr:MAG: cysteine--tRNA ligase [Elusimicrobia bacterium GWA2_56_46]OGR54655.1 MAG: cysteine--tRNA ligase [Elusimicrobia bacterium GWC2_56_31]HBB66775.1 cysteine--tRNA ligase [Elusimicrobiota bacterium]HBW21967.1 cysteine--tRNA ligase [Elusimicrobiota bacterium]